MRAGNQALRAAAPQRVPAAASEYAQLVANRRRLVMGLVEAAEVVAAVVGAAHQRSQASIVADAAVVDGCFGDVDDVPARLCEPAQPLLLVATGGQRLVERPRQLQRRPPQQHVRAPYELGLGVLCAQVERGYRRQLPAAAARRGPFESRADRAAERVRLGVAAGALDQLAQP